MTVQEYIKSVAYLENDLSSNQQEELKEIIKHNQALRICQRTWPKLE
jgi:hypothetical protein